MTRRTYVYDPDLKEMVEVVRERAPAVPAAPAVWGDIKPFRSMVDGTPITDRGQLRRHYKQHGVAPTDDFKETWAKARTERSQRLCGTHTGDRSDRIRALRDAFEHNRNQQRARGRDG